MNKKSAARVIAVAASAAMILTAVPVDAQAAGKTAGADGSDKIVDIMDQLSDSSAEYEEGEAIVLFNSTGQNKLSTAAFEEELPDGVEVEKMVTFDETEETAAQTESVKESDGALTVELVTSEKYSTEQLIRKLEKLNGVDLVEPNYIYHAEDTSDVLLGNEKDLLWGIDNEGQNGGTKDLDTNADHAGIREKEATEDETVIAIIDTGIDYTNSELAPYIWENPYPNVLMGEHGFNFMYDNGYYNSEEPLDDNGHGTHCTGIMKSVIDAGTDDSQTANVKFMGLKFLDVDGSGDGMDAIYAYKYIDAAISLGINVKAVNNSWGGEGHDSVLDAIVTRVGEKGCISLFAAGNDGLNNDEYDMSSNLESDYAVVVAAENENGELASFSDYGKETVDIAAPGTEILSTVITNTFNPSIYTEEQLDQLTNSFEDFDRDDVSELGIITAVSDPDDTIEVTIDHDNYITEKKGSSQEGSLKISAEVESEHTYRVAIPYTAKSSSCENQLSMMLSYDSPAPEGEITIDDVGVTLIYDVAASDKDKITNFSSDISAGTQFGFYTYGKMNYWDHIATESCTYRKEGQRYIVIEFTPSLDGTFTMNVDDLGFSASDLSVADCPQFGQLDYYNGTSMATPYVTGACALIASKKEYASLSAEERVNILLGCTRKNDNMTGLVSTGGSLDLSKLVTGDYKQIPRLKAVKMDGTKAVVKGSFLSGCTFTVNGEKVETTEVEDGVITFAADQYVDQYVVLEVTNPTSGESAKKKVYLGYSKEDVSYIGTTSDVLGSISAMATDGNYIYLLTDGQLYKAERSYDDDGSDVALMMEVLPIEDTSILGNSSVIDDQLSVGLSFEDNQIACCDGKVYLFAYTSQLSSMERSFIRQEYLVCYDPENYDSPWAVVEIPEEYKNTAPLDMTRISGQTLGSYNGKIYVMGGYDSVAKSATDQIAVYDPSKEQWEISNTSLPEAQVGGQAIQIGNNLVYTLGMTSEMTDATETDGANITSAKNMVFNGKRWELKDAQIKCYRFEKVSYGKALYYKPVASLGITENGVIYTGMTAEGLGNVFTYSLANDAYIASDYNLDQNGDAADDSYGGTVIGDTLYVIRSNSDEAADVYTGDVWNGMVCVYSNNAVDLWTDQTFYMPGSKISLSAEVTSSKYYLKNAVVQDEDGHSAKLNAGNTATIRATSGVSLKTGSVYRYVQKIKLNKSSLSVSYAKKKSVKLSATVTPKSTKTYPVNAKLKWSSSNKKYATVSSTGKVTFRKAGIGHTVKITAKAVDGSKKKAVCKIKIKK